MDKKVWTKPEVSVVEFEANEYVSACGVAPAGNGYLILENDSNSNSLNYHSGGSNIPNASYGGSYNTQGYLTYMYENPGMYFPGDPDDGSVKVDTLLIFSYGTDSDGSNNTSAIWQNDCSGHSHVVPTNAYDGYFVSTSDATGSIGNADIPTSISAWNSVKIWFQEIAGSLTNIHASLLSTTSRSA